MRLLLLLNNKKYTVFIFIFILAVFIVSIYPIFVDGIIYKYECQDLDYHLLRIEGIKNELVLNNYHPYIHSLLLNGYGYGNGLFYPDLLLYIPAFFRILGLSISVSYKIFIALITALTIISSYFSINYITKSRFITMCFIPLFILSQYRMSNVFVRAAVGEYCAYIFIPIVAAGIYDFLYMKFKKPWIIGLGFLGLFLTHTITFISALIITFIILVFNYKYIFKNKILLLKLMKTAGIVVLLSSFYWIPMLEQCFSGEFCFNDPWVAWFGIMPISFIKIFDISEFSSIGILILLLPCIRLYITNKTIEKMQESEQRLLKLSNRLILIGLILIFLATDLFPWGLFKNTPLNYIQFPWRLFSFASISLATAIAISIYLLCKHKKRTMILIAIFCITSLYAINFINPFMGVKKYTDADNSAEDYYNKSENTFAIGGYEWLPLGTDVKKLTDPNHVTTANGEQLSLVKKGTTITFENKDTESFYYDIPLLYYKGYTAEILTDKGESYQLTVEKSENNNLIRVFNNEQIKGQIIVSYTGTVLQKISAYISILSLVIFIFTKKVYHRINSFRG